MVPPPVSASTWPVTPVVSTLPPSVSSFTRAISRGTVTLNSPEECRGRLPPCQSPTIHAVSPFTYAVILYCSNWRRASCSRRGTKTSMNNVTNPLLLRAVHHHRAHVNLHPQHLHRRQRPCDLLLAPMRRLRAIHAPPASSPSKQTSGAPARASTPASPPTCSNRFNFFPSFPV